MAGVFRAGVVPALLVAAMVSAAVPAVAGDPPAGQVHVSGWFGTTWDYPNGFHSFYTHADRLSQASPFWFHPLADGSVTAYEPDPGAKQVAEVESLIKAVASAHGVKLIPCIGEPPAKFGKDIVRTLLHDDKLRAVHERAIVDLAVSHGFDGLDIDYESFKKEDRAELSTFIAELGTQMHARGKLLTMAVHAKTADPGDWDGPQSQDWIAIGAAVDMVRIMVYDFHEDSGEPGPIAPLDWFKQVLAYALTTIPRQRIQMGLPVYGYDWDKPAAAEDVTVARARALAAKKGVPILFDPEAREAHFNYEEDDLHHQVWYEDGRSVPEKLALARDAGIDGIVVWHLGSEEADFWDAVGAGAAGPAPGDSKAVR